MKLRLCIVLALLIPFAHTPLRAQASGGSLLVLSKGAHSLSIVNPQTLRVVASMPAGDDPHEVAASPDGHMAYVSNYGFGQFHTLTRIDLVAHRTLGTIDTGVLGGPHGLAYAGGKVWFTSEVAKAVGRYDPATGKIDFVLGTGQNRIHMIEVWPDLEHIFASNVNSGTISIIDREPISMPPPPPGMLLGRSGPGGPPPGGPPPARMDWNQTVVPVGRGSEGFDVSPDHRELWVANAGDATISVIDIAAKKVVATLHVNVPGANRLRFTPDGRRVLVSAGPELVVLDAASRTVVKRIPIGHGSGGVLIQPDGARAYVACSPDDNVAVIDLRTLTVVGRIHAGANPDGMTWIPAQ